MGIWNTKNYKGQPITWYSADIVEKIEAEIKDYKSQCNIPGNCLDKRLCSTCFIGGALELGESILDIIKEG